MIRLNKQVVAKPRNQRNRPFGLKLYLGPAIHLFSLSVQDCPRTYQDCQNRQDHFHIHLLVGNDFHQNWIWPFHRSQKPRLFGRHGG